MKSVFDKVRTAFTRESVGKNPVYVAPSPKVQELIRNVSPYDEAFSDVVKMNKAALDYDRSKIEADSRRYASRNSVEVAKLNFGATNLRLQAELEKAERNAQLEALKFQYDRAKAEGDHRLAMELAMKRSQLEQENKLLSSALFRGDAAFKANLDYDTKLRLLKQEAELKQKPQWQQDQERVHKENEHNLSWWERVNKVQRAAIDSDRAYELQQRQLQMNFNDSLRRNAQNMAQIAATNDRNRETLELERRKYDDARADYLRNWNFQQSMLRLISGGIKGGNFV